MNKMMEQFVNKFQEEINKIDREYLRKIQGDMHLCSAKCCSDLNSSQESFQRCLEKCSIPIQRANQYMQSEMQEMENRLQRCVHSCADRIKDENEADKVKNRAKMEQCIDQCSDELIKILPSYTKRMKDWFNAGNHQA
jgi:Ser-tRNA(Ala) deacylase AlaX